MVGINKEEIGKHDTNNHEHQMPGLQLRTNLRHNMSNGHIKEGSGREGESNRQSSFINLRNPQSNQSSQKSSNRGGRSKQSNVRES